MTTITMLPILRSNNLKAAGYDEASQTLRIQFQNLTAWDYVGVPPEAVVALRAAPSMGSYFHAHIRGNAAYTATQVQLDEE